MALVKCVQGEQAVHRGVSFERILTATSVPSDCNAYPRLTLPSWFVRQHGDKIRLSAVLQNEASGEKWTVQIVVRHPEKNPQVMFYGGGWKDFAVFNALVESDRLTFTLTAMSEFEVSISDDAEDLPVPGPRKRSKRPRSSQRLTSKLSPGRKLRNATVKKRKHNVPDPGLGKLRLKYVTPEEEDADSTSDSSISKLPLGAQVSPLKTRHGKDPGLLMVYRQELTMVTSLNGNSNPWNSIDEKGDQARECTRNDAPRKKLQTSLPSFVKQLPSKHFQRMEIPRDFFRTYGSRFHKDVKLQGIYDGSPVRAVTCCSRRDGKNLRVELTDGWKEFNSENYLEAGQKFEFTLTGDSFFEVRRVYS